MYESYYGLNSKPFQLTPDPAFFFASKWHKRAMSYLQYGLSQAEGFIVITGDIGTGKTTIANSLLADIEDDIVAAQIVTPKLSPDELVKMVAAKFEIDVAGKTKADILKDLEGYLFALSAQGRRALLLVDEAQNLPLETIEELRMLSNFQQAGKPLLQSFLLGQEELQPILRAPNMEQFRQRIVASCHLAPLTLEEVQSYIEYRLHHAGWNGAQLFSSDAYEHIYKFTRGVPRKINTLMDRILLFGFLEELEVLDEAAVDSVIDEVREEMFVPDSPEIKEEEPVAEAGQESTPEASQADTDTVPRQRLITPNGNEVKDAEYYKAMLGELVDALDDAISHKIKLTQYIDKLLKKKYRTYVRLKSDD
ncbi:XrtA/PEP-CTERM system-associated ATPase [uncultured Alteromonas sp.]|jgi:putative secretion ATPase (PEP-CTERM system associated)|uniref:XrtA/PEP-CTERM system-associated ATPase n=1 Tax=uncultured Alteromonas sp. TaxID=179113 RepID=UPI0025F60D55|nr:XrtA/PEP-CTERM system-associated ATPase [uncultured Alteromonas sp.]